MKKSFVALALLVGTATMLTTLAAAQDAMDYTISKRKTFESVEQSRAKDLTKAIRLSTSAGSDTLFIGHVSTGGSSPWHIGSGPGRPGVGGLYEGMWDFDTYDGGTIDSMQGWESYRTPYTWQNLIEPDVNRPWYANDFGNRCNKMPVQGRTSGIIGAWHADNGNYAPLPNSWTPLAGSLTAWCGLRACSDNSVVDLIAYGGTGNAINGNTAYGQNGSTVAPYYNTKNYPGYCSWWDQMLYRDVRVEDGASLTVSFLYETQMDHRVQTNAYVKTGWFDKDPLSMATDNFISQDAQAGAGPVDSFMVYVGVPTDPTSCMYTDATARPIFDLKRRWFSEVISIDKPYREILSTFGHDSVYRATPYTQTVPNSLIQPMLDAQAGDDGVIRVVFRVKTNQSFSDDANTGGSFNSTNKGAAQIDEVAISGLSTMGFENPGDINNNIEPANAGSPSVGEGYALTAWHSTGRPPKHMAHTHALAGGNGYAPLDYVDVCGSWDSPLRGCDVNNVIVSSTDHDLLEASAGPIVDAENFGGFRSPTICMIVPDDGTPNAWGIDLAHLQNNANWLVLADTYNGVFSNAAVMCNYMSFTVSSYPTLQKNGDRVWGDVFYNGLVYWGQSACFQWSRDIKRGIYTVAGARTGFPDSIKLHVTRCTFFTDEGMPPPTYEGHYTDNVMLGMLPAVTGTSDAIRGANLWTWYGDAFPFNETEVPGSAAWDTCTALIKNSNNAAGSTGDELCNIIPQDSMIVIGSPSDLLPRRVDCVFRIYPGPGNYVIPGNMASGVRKVQAAPVPEAATASDGSFWGTYMGTPGEYSKGTHAGGWNVDTWNSVRCDTAERNLFANDTHTANAGGGLPVLTLNRWSSTIHESDARLSALGILKNRCFLIDPTPGQPVDHTNITCTYPAPAWALNDASGFDELQTNEYTGVFPDGLLTAGSHVEYFFRMTKVADEGNIEGPYQMCPDTNRIFPNWNWANTNNSDATRWADISILPDRWKEYAGLGQACMLVYNYNNNRGNARSWWGIADSIGATAADKYGAHNGWHKDGSYVGPTFGLNDYNRETDCGTNPAIAVWKHGGQAGSTFDFINVRGCDDPVGCVNQIGTRFAQAPTGPEAGKESKAGPTPLMLRTFYRLVFILTGDSQMAQLGPFADVGSDCLRMLGTEFLDDEEVTRGVWGMGDGFVEGHITMSPAHTAFFTDKLGVTLKDPSYFELTGSTSLYPDMTPTAVINAASAYSVQNSCYWTNDVLEPNTVVGAVPSGAYQNLGPSANWPLYSGIFTDASPSHVGVALVDGWDIDHLFQHGGGATAGRVLYFADVATSVFASLCSFSGAPTVDVPKPATFRAVDFLGNIGNNPVQAGGKAFVHFGLAQAGRVEVKVYDVTGRLVKTLADRNFEASPTAQGHTLVWDGSNDQGQVVSRGVYFTQVKIANSGFVSAKKVTILK